MQKDWSAYVTTLLLGAGGLLLLGWLIGEPAWTLAIGLAAYLIWTLSQVRRLFEWLSHPEQLIEPPESHGLWGDLFDGQYRQQQNHLQAQERLKNLISRVQESTNSLQDGVIMINADGTMEWWNQTAEHLLGLRKGTDQGQYVYNLIRAPEFKHYFEHKDYRDPLELASPARAHLTLQLQINLFGDDDRLILAKDVTRIHQLEQMRRDFVSNISHEMRTPLTVISGYLETLLEQADELPTRWRRPLTTMNQQAARMEALITDLILLAKLETSDANVSRQITDIPKLLESICEDAEALSAERHHRIRLQLDSKDHLLGDEGQLRSAFSNLVFNAVKYTPAQGEISIRWWRDQMGCHLAVRDNGIGIDPSHIPRLTERFYRADPSRHSDTGGTGLGLAIVKHVLINHDARLEIRSTAGQGSEFSCHFPCERRRQAEPIPPLPEDV